jgi:hypothetical protein
MPTFHFYKGGKLVHTIQGADLPQIQKKINELKEPEISKFFSET